MDRRGKFEFYGAAYDDSTFLMTRTQASTVLLVIQTAIKSRQRRHNGGTTTAAAMSDLNLKRKVWTRRILQ